MNACGTDHFDQHWHTLRELDELEGWTKGSAFRRFKRLREDWIEGREFHVLEATRDAPRIARLKQARRLYAGTINAVLLSTEAARQIRDARDGPGEDADP